MSIAQIIEDIREKFDFDHVEIATHNGVTWHGVAHASAGADFGVGDTTVAVKGNAPHETARSLLDAVIATATAA